MQNRYDEFFHEAIKGIKQAFERICTNHGKDNIAGFALFSDEDALTICTSACTKEFYENGDDWVFVNEWDLEWEEISCLDTAYKLLQELHEAGAIDSPKEIFLVLVDALKKLIQEEVFGSECDRDKFFLMFDVSDSELPEEVFSNWAKELNTPRVYRSYTAVMEKW